MSLQPFPSYIPSNYTPDEVLRVLEPCLPPQLRSHIEQLTVEAEQEKQWANEEVEEARTAQRDAEKRTEEVEDQLTRVRDIAADLDVKWSEVKDLIPKTRQGRAEVEMLEEYLAKLIEESKT